MEKWISDLIAKEFGDAVATAIKLVKIEIFKLWDQEPQALQAPACESMTAAAAEVNECTRQGEPALLDCFAKITK